MKAYEDVIIRCVQRGKKGDPQEVLWAYPDPRVGVREVNIGHIDGSFPRIGVKSGAEQAR